MTTHISKTWFEDGKLITQFFEEKDIYKREWVGLTDDDIRPLCKESWTMDTVKQWAVIIEAKLKQKNGYT